MLTQSNVMLPCHDISISGYDALYCNCSIKEGEACSLMQLLKPGGRMVAVVATSVATEHDAMLFTKPLLTTDATHGADAARDPWETREVILSLLSFKYHRPLKYPQPAEVQQAFAREVDCQVARATAAVREEERAQSSAQQAELRVRLQAASQQLDRMRQEHRR